MIEEPYRTSLLGNKTAVMYLDLFAIGVMTLLVADPGKTRSKLSIERNMLRIIASFLHNFIRNVFG